MVSSGRKTITNFLWRFAERCGAQGVQFVVSVILARLLDPETYGTVALVTVFITVLNVFVDSGLGNALIQKKDADDSDFSSVFYFNLVLCLILYGLMFALAPLIAAFYNNGTLKQVVRVLSLTIVISGVKNIQQAYVSRTMQFKRFFFATLAGTVGAAVVGIVVAYHGGGVWALVAQQLFNALTDTIVLWVTVKWRPRKLFSWNKLKALLSFGWKLLAARLLSTVYDNIRQLIIGKMYTSANLAYYNRGQQLPSVFAGNIHTSVDSVLFPMMSKFQEDIQTVKNMMRRSIKISLYILAPLMVGMASCAEVLISLLLTDKWLPCVPFLRIFCIIYLFYPIHTVNLDAIQALGRSDLILKLDIIKKILGLLLIVISMKYGVMAIAVSTLIGSFINQIINTWPNKKLLDYSYFDQIKDIMPCIVMACIMGMVVYLVGTLQLPRMILLVVQIATGVVVYIFLSVVFRIEAFIYLWSTLSGMLNRSKK